ncbi:thioredoxin-like protein [Russula earlei]|uniref:Thioredoxin-like protein n=1 Tax=Russula earlei TaxID=71964 RepID=A0ACC0UI62_9AGAM|nr:thioredoxin-like protein [Russula earlei]
MSNQDTEFDEALRKHGILPPREPTPPTPSPPLSPTLDDILEELTSTELRELGEDVQDDAVERQIAQRRAQLIVKERLDARRTHFGTVIPIGRDDYTREVTEASKQDEPGDSEARGTRVVCFLYKDGILRSDRTHIHVRALATRHPRTKFVSIVGDKCIPNLPDSRVPMFIVYRKGQIVTQIVAWGSDRERKLEELEGLLIASGAIIPSEKKPLDLNDDQDEESDEDFSQTGSKSNWASYSTKSVRNSSNPHDSGSDFDL